MGTTRLILAHDTSLKNGAPVTLWLWDYKKNHDIEITVDIIKHSLFDIMAAGTVMSRPLHVDTMKALLAL